MKFNKKTFIMSVLVCALVWVTYNNGVVTTKADTSAKSTQGVVLKTAEVKVDKVIVSPKERPNNSSVSNGNSRGNAKSSNLIDYAYKFMGTPYVFGATGPSSFDCSGFTSYVFSHMGISLPRTSQSQFYSGAQISRNELVAGDLVFFNTYTKLGHVGIYIGGGDFIHASSSRGVTVSSLNDGYYSARYAGAVRK